MIDPKNLLAIIPARAGSKRLPNKNILPLKGRPLIQWTIQAALDSGCVDTVVVSTDSKKIADVARHCGASVPFIRPEHLSNDESKSIDVVLHVIDELKSKGRSFDYVMLLQPTSPLRTGRHIREAVSLLHSKDAIAVVSVCPISHPVEWVGEISSDLSLDSFFENMPINKRSQDFTKKYRLNGAIYLISVDGLIKNKALTSRKGTYAYLMRPEDSVDIDTEIDHALCELLINRRSDLSE